MMTSTYSVFGLPMQQRSSRRRFVIAAYALLFVICGLTIAFIHVAPYLYSYAIYAIMFFLVLVFGWQGRGGLIKPFPNKPPRPDHPVATMIELQLAPQRLLSRDAQGWRNDERELSRRDLAHYRAYQPISFVLVLLLVLSAIANHPWPWISLPILLWVNFAVALLGTATALTLPAAVILWTEPDLD